MHQLINNYLKSIWNKAEREYRNEILKLCERNPKSILLDCGCDTGEFTIEVANAIGTGCIYGIDIIKERYIEAEKRGIIIRESDLNKKIPFEDNSIDVVIANQVIEHLFDLDNFIREVYRILKPNGYSLICTENLSSWHNILALCFGYQPFSMTNIVHKRSIGNPYALHALNKEIKSYKSFEHVRVLAFRGLKDLFELYSFKIEKILGLAFFPLPVCLSKLLAKIDKRHAAFLLIKVRKV